MATYPETIEVKAPIRKENVSGYVAMKIATKANYRVTY
jgi:hypothetical protein